MESWVYLHPRALRAISMGLVITGAVFFVRIVQLDTKIAGLLAERAEEAEAVSEELGG